MKTSIQWLKNYIDIPWEPRELAERLTLAGLEVEGIEEVGGVAAGVVVGEILTRESHPNADKLSVCTVDIGADEPLQIVCGAPNCNPGVKAPVATIGTILGEDFKIKKGKLRGEVSEGMLCAVDELGLGDAHEGILELPADSVAGTPLRALYEADVVIDWEVTPNRPDWLSHIGIAREIAAVTGTLANLRLPEIPLAESADTAVETLTSVDVQAPDLCPRYTARVIRNVKIGPSPEWMQTALRAVGLRPINNVVDITNYVMLECGQPLHAFDYDFLAGHRIVVRRATDGEMITTLDDTEIKLTTENLLICDAERGVALAGVMGGANSEIGENTTTVLLESAVFASSNIRATSHKLGISTDSSHRFERGVDIEMCEFASRRAADLIRELAGGELAKGVIDAYAAPFAPCEVTARFARINSLIGVEIPAATVQTFFEQLGLEIVSVTDETIIVVPPPFRGDLEREVDLIEEVARLYGLDNIEGSAATARLGGMRDDDTYYPIEEARAQLRALGLDETMTYSFINPEAAVNCTGFTDEQLIRPSNPLSSELGTMRPTLIPGILQSVAHNIAHNNDELAFFELGRVLVNAPGFPEERDEVAIIMTGRAHPERFGAERESEIDFYDLKGMLECWLEARRMTAECAADEHPAFRKGACAALTVGGEKVAVFGEVCDALTTGLRLKHPLFLAVVQLDALRGCETAPMTYQALPPFPAVVRDIALLADASLPCQAVIDTVADMKLPLIERVDLFDIYEDEKTLGAGKKSMAYSVTYRDPRQTMTDKKVNKLHERVRSTIQSKLGVELR